MVHRLGLAVSKITEAAAGAGLPDVAHQGVTLLAAPYAGCGVVNGGAVEFVGVVGDYLWHGRRWRHGS